MVNAFLFGLIVVGALHVSCGENQKPPPPLTDESLANALYPSQMGSSSRVQLKDGKYSEQNPGGSGVTTVTLMDVRGRGLIDGDKTEDAVVVLAASGGGSGTFYSLVVVLNKEGSTAGIPVPGAWTDLGDRVVVHSVDVDQERIVLRMREHAPQDPLCCPSMETTRTYSYNGDLKLVSTQPVR